MEPFGPCAPRISTLKISRKVKRLRAYRRHLEKKSHFYPLLHTTDIFEKNQSLRKSMGKGHFCPFGDIAEIQFFDNFYRKKNKIISRNCQQLFQTPTYKPNLWGIFFLRIILELIDDVLVIFLVSPNRNHQAVNIIFSHFLVQ